MTREELLTRLNSTLEERMPLPGAGETPLRHRRLMDVGRENLSLARLAEAHWDAVAILAEASREPVPGAIYGVWASERPGQEVKLNAGRGGRTISGSKMFCSGAGMIDRTLLSVAAPEQLLLDIDLRGNAGAILFDGSSWKTAAFLETQTSTATFHEISVAEECVIGDSGWYLRRPGFWHGATGPAACWAGGAAGLLDYAMRQRRNDPHTLAHLGAMHASVWAMRSCLDSAGHEIDQAVEKPIEARVRALTVRHLVEQACTDILRRLPRAYGPHPLAMDEDVLRRDHELDLYLRQSHAERDLESLGCDLKQQQESSPAGRLI